MKAEIALLVSLLFLATGASLPGGSLEARPDARAAAEQEASENTESAVSLRSKGSPDWRSRAAKRRFFLDSRRGRDFSPSSFSSARRTQNVSFRLSHLRQSLYTLFRIFRL